jgi:hypothetical protein
MIQVFWDMVNQPPFGPLQLGFVFHDEHARLMFCFVQVRLYLVKGRALWFGSISSHSVVATNLKQKIICLNKI